jgi:hypothetical protein
VTPYYAGLPGARSQLAAYVFWLVAAPLAYALCAAWYRRRAHRLGLALRWERFLGLGVCLFAVLAVLYALPHRPVPTVTGSGSVAPLLALDAGEVIVAALLSPLVVVAFGLLVLGWVERSWPVAVAALVYGGVATVINLYGFGQIPPWLARPHGAMNEFFASPGPNVVLLGTILLLGAALTAVGSWRSHVRT